MKQRKLARRYQPPSGQTKLGYWSLAMMIYSMFNVNTTTLTRTHLLVISEAKGCGAKERRRGVQGWGNDRMTMGHLTDVSLQCPGGWFKEASNPLFVVLC